MASCEYTSESTSDMLEMSHKLHCDEIACALAVAVVFEIADDLLALAHVVVSAVLTPARFVRAPEVDGVGRREPRRRQHWPLWTTGVLCARAVALAAATGGLGPVVLGTVSVALAGVEAAAVWRLAERLPTDCEQQSSERGVGAEKSEAGDERTVPFAHHCGASNHSRLSGQQRSVSTGRHARRMWGYSTHCVWRIHPL